MLAIISDVDCNINSGKQALFQNERDASGNVTEVQFVFIKGLSDMQLQVRQKWLGKFLEITNSKQLRMHLKPPGGNYLKVFHLNSYGMDLESTMVGENFRNHLPEIAKNAL